MLFGDAMPKLSSGRHVAVGTTSLVDQIKFGSDVSVYAIITAYRLEVQKPEDLRRLLPVLYYNPEEGLPIVSGKHQTGWLVQDILAGDAGWSDDEINEFTSWLEADAALAAYLREAFDEIHNVIVASPIWSSELASDEPENGLPN
jgi:hypothetical protein